MASFRNLSAAMREESPLRELVQNGMGAFERSDVSLVAEDERGRIGDSLDLDAASADEHPGANRWDYVVSIPDLKELMGIEPHSAKDSEISVVIAKRKHSLEYLRSHLRDGCRVTRWYWVSHGTVGFSKMDRARRRLDQNGITFAGRIIRTFD